MSESVSSRVSPLQVEILNRIDAILQRSAEQTQPLEVDPAREELFTLFVTAHGAGFLDEESPVDLCAEELCRILGQRWGLDQAAQTSVAQQQKMSEMDLARMRLLWSLMRMWMEWTYAWERWEEFHSESTVAGS